MQGIAYAKSAEGGKPDKTRLVTSEVNDSYEFPPRNRTTGNVQSKGLEAVMKRMTIPAMDKWRMVQWPLFPPYKIVKITFKGELER
jgi:hypothetical protein